MTMTTTFRPGTPDDTHDVFDVSARALADLEHRVGVADTDNHWLDPAFVAGAWAHARPRFEHLAHTAEHFWVAEQDAQIVGYARATLHDGVRELTEFFVMPDRQAGGIGRELLARTFPVGGARRRATMSTADVRALARYLKAGVYPRFPICFVSGTPRPIAIETDLIFEPVVAVADALVAIRAIDQAVLGFARDALHAFLLRDRRADLYRRDDRIVGYGYVGRDTGPIALLDASDFPAVLARGETAAAARNQATVQLKLPLINRAAVDHLLGRGYRLDEFAWFFMSDEAFGTFENYIVSNPPFFL